MKQPRIEGLAALDRELLGFEPKVSKKLAKSSLRKAMKPVQVTAKSLTPVRTGNARRLVSLFALNPKGRYPAAAFVGWRMGKRHRRKGNDPFYIRWLEWGKKGVPKVAMLRRSADRHMGVNGESVRIFAKDLTAQIERVYTGK